MARRRADRIGLLFLGTVLGFALTVLGLYLFVRSTQNRRITERVQRWLDMLGLDPEVVGEHVVVTPTCGLAGATPEWAGRAVRLSATVARNL